MNNTEIPYDKLAFWDKLSDSQREYLKQNSGVRQFKKGELLYGDGDSCLGMIYMLSGGIRVCIISEDGREITLFRVGTGECCVLSASCVISQIEFDTVMYADEEASVFIINAGAFARLAEENVHVNSFMYELATERFSQVMWVMQDIIFLRFDQRLAGFLVAYYDRTGEKQLRMTQEVIAQNVNSAREVVARMLRQFAADGLVEMKRGCITLKDIDALRDISA